jgi:hypothetical protein
LRAAEVAANNTSESRGVFRLPWNREEIRVIIEKIRPGSGQWHDAQGTAGSMEPPEQAHAEDNPEPRKGLRLTVYRAAGQPDCTLGGITSKAANVTVTMIRETGVGRTTTEYPIPQDCQVFTPAPDAPEVVFVIRHHPGAERWVHLQPTANPGWHYMHGGNYAGSHDSRWDTISGADLVAVHDRHEG